MLMQKIQNQQDLLEETVNMLAVILVAHIDWVQKDNKGRKQEDDNKNK